VFIKKGLRLFLEGPVHEMKIFLSFPLCDKETQSAAEPSGALAHSPLCFFLSSLLGIVAFPRRTQKAVTPNIKLLKVTFLFSPPST